MATGGGSLAANKRSKIASSEPSTSSEKIPIKCSVTGNGKVSNGNMVSNHESPSPRRDGRTLNCAGAKQDSNLGRHHHHHHNQQQQQQQPGHHSPSNNRKASQSYDTLTVDVDLANRRFGNVSPGRRCLSDSKLTVGKRQRNIPASAPNKRRLDFSLTPPTKRRRSDGPKGTGSPAPESQAKQVDHNQNFKEVRECVPDRTATAATAATTATTATTAGGKGEAYKAKHSIGHRKASAQIASLSEAVLTGQRRLTTTATQALSAPAASDTVTSDTVTLLSQSVDSEGQAVGACPWESERKALACEPETLSVRKRKETAAAVTAAANPSTPDSLSEEISDKFLKVDSDILFKKDSAIDVVVTDCNLPVQQDGPYQDVFVDSVLPDARPAAAAIEKDGYLDLPHKQTPSDSCEDESSVFTEDSNATDDSSGGGKEVPKPNRKQYNKKNWHDVQPRAPRKRRIASLTAETKVHLLYEKDEAEAPKRPALSRVPVPRTQTKRDSNGSSPSQCPDESPFTQCKHQAVSHSGVTVPCADCIQLYYAHPFQPVQQQDKPLNLVLSDQTCADCGRRAGPPSGEPQSSCSCDQPSRTTGAAAHCLSGANAGTNAVLKAVRNPASAPVLGTAKRPSLVPIRMRRATVDTAECQKLTSILLCKNPLMLRMARLSTDGEGVPDEVPPALGQTLQQIGLLQAGEMIQPLLSPPSLLPATNHLPKSRLPKKILNPADLRPSKGGRRKSTNGWKGVSEPILRPVVLMSDAVREYRYCYDAIRRKDDEIRTQDCVLLRAAANRRKEPAYVAKVASLWEEPDSGDLMMTLLWYYQPEHTEVGRQPHHLENELFACRHWDVNSVACIEDRCYVLTPAEYSRYRAKLQRQKEAIRPGRPCVPQDPDNYARAYRLPPNDVSPENVFLCRQVYDFRQKRVLKNPS